MRPEQLIALMNQAWFRICSEDRPPKEWATFFFTLLKNENDVVIKNFFSAGSKNYDGATKYPPESYWRKVFAAEKRTIEIRAKAGVSAVGVVSEDERKRVAQMAAEIAQRFERMGGQHRERVSPVRERVRRMTEQARLGNVMVEEIGHALEGTFIPLADAKAAGLMYLDPCVWLNERKQVSRW